ncbi:MAG: EAL domain-containing protein [Acidimicrobiales bacterium]|nr:EAL domain-containing protein [Acidimicrobiales bacterium]
MTAAAPAAREPGIAPDAAALPTHARPSRAGRLLRIALTCVAVAYLVCMKVVPRADGAELAWLDVWFHNLLLVACGIVTWLGSRGRRADRAGWRFASAAVLLNATANFTWVLLFDSASLSPSDALFLAFYPAMYVSVVLLARSRASTRGLGQWLDGGIAGFGVAALVAAFLFPPLLEGAGGGALAVAVNLSYPMADLLLIAMLLAGLAPAGWRPDRPLALLIVGLLVNTAADASYLLQSAADTYQQTSAANLLWIVAVVIIANAPWVAARRAAVAATGAVSAPHDGVAPDGRDEIGVVVDGANTGKLLLPAGAAIAAFVLVLVSSERAVQRVAVVLAATTLVLAGARVTMAYRELRSLANSRREARTDELTGLPNRRAFLEQLDLELSGLAAGRPVSVLLMDLDGFKEINDTLGHHSGDQLLVEVGRILRGELRTSDVVARLGGDEFAVLLDDADLDGALTAAGTLRAALEAPITVGGLAVAVHISIGIASAPTHGSDAVSLLRFADIAMYEAKHARSGVKVYDTLPADRQRDRLELAHDIRRALSDGEFILHYQPKVEVATGAVRSTEALARWQHPTRGLLFPDTFLPLVEHGNLGSQLTRCVLDCAIRQLADWQRQGRPWTVAVNIAPPDLLDESLPDYVGHQLRRRGVDPGRLVLEITEGALVADPERAARTVRRLRDAGSLISLDDFGVGFSSLVHLRTMDFDELKLDRTLAIGLEADPKGQAIVHAAVGLADALGLRLVVEGVETTAERDLIASLGARYVQGYVYSRPLPPEQLETFSAEPAAQAPSAPGGSVGQAEPATRVALQHGLP